jgi:hypothetical protein
MFADIARAIVAVRHLETDTFAALAAEFHITLKDYWLL